MPRVDGPAPPQAPAQLLPPEDLPVLQITSHRSRPYHRRSGVVRFEGLSVADRSVIVENTVAASGVSVQSAAAQLIAEHTVSGRDAARVAWRTATRALEAMRAEVLLEDVIIEKAHRRVGFRLALREMHVC